MHEKTENKIKTLIELGPSIILLLTAIIFTLGQLFYLKLSDSLDIIQMLCYDGIAIALAGMFYIIIHQ